jgi:trk system potassium uptake protein TrkH
MGILYSALISLAAGSLGLIGIKKGTDLRPKEGFAVVAFGWISFAAFGSLPYVLTGAIPNYTNAFFETMSGFTTTGATILTDVESLPHGVLFWRSLTHWIGGMGIIVMSIAILPFLGIGGMQLFKAEVPGPVADKLKPRITETAKILWGIYILISAAEVLLLLAGGMNIFDSLCHTFGTMATGGYSTKNASIGHYNSAFIDYVIILFMLIAGTNFSLHYRAFTGDFKTMFKNPEFKFYLLIIGVATFVISLDTYFNVYNNLAETIRYTLFQVISIMTTTGYGTADYEQWSVSSQIILFALMFIGGSAGSTGGGIKVMRILLLLKFAYSEIIRLIHPNAVLPVKLGKHTVDKKIIMNIVGSFVVFALITVAGTIIMSFFGMDIQTSFGIVAATINNIGPGLGNVGPTDNYAFVPQAGKWILTFFMILGRLEIFTIMILLIPSFWKK